MSLILELKAHQKIRMSLLSTLICVTSLILTVKNSASREIKTQFLTAEDSHKIINNQILKRTKM